MNKREWKRNNNADLTIDSRKRCSLMAVHLETPYPYVTVLVVHSSGAYQNQETGRQLIDLADQIADRMKAPAQPPQFVMPPPKFVLTDDMRKAFEEAAKTGAAFTEMPGGALAFINRGGQPDNTAHLDCPACGGSGHKDDVAQPSQPAIPEGWNQAIAALRYYAEGQHIQHDGTGVATVSYTEQGTQAQRALDSLGVAYANKPCGPQPTGSAK